MRANADIRFECSQCGQPIRVDAEGAGEKANCPSCQEELIVPHMGTLDGSDLELSGLNSLQPRLNSRTSRSGEVRDEDVRTLRDQLVEV